MIVTFYRCFMGENMKSIRSSEEALTMLNSIIIQTDTGQKALYQYFEQLATENEQLKLTVHKLRSQANIRTATMHSKLTDALRE